MRAVFALALALSAGAPAPTPDVQPATIALDVVVEDARGRAVETLGPADFSVSEQAHPLSIDSVRFVRATGSVPAPLAVPISTASDETAGVADTRRLFAIFLDEFHVTPGAGAPRWSALSLKILAPAIWSWSSNRSNRCWTSG